MGQEQMGGMITDMIGNVMQMLYGTWQMGRGNVGLANLKRPTYVPDQGIKYNQQLASQVASQGLPDSAKNFYGDAIDRNLSSTISAVQGGGGNLGMVNDSFSQSNNAFKDLMVADAIQKQRNQSVLMEANKQLRDENFLAWDYNVRRPYEREFEKYTQMTNAGAQNLFGGLKQGGASSIAAADAGSSDDFGGRMSSSSSGNMNGFGNGMSSGFQSGGNDAMYQQFLQWMKTQNSGGNNYDFQGGLNYNNFG